MPAISHPGPALRAVLFDLDGTLVDTADDFVPVVQSLQREFGTEPLPAERIRSCVSNGARALVKLGLGLAEDDADFERWRQRLLTLYGEILGRHARLYPGVEDLLTAIEGARLQWGIVTNKPRVYTLPLLETLGLTPGSVVCPQDVEQPKPNPESLHKACGELGCETRESLYIGDHERDIIAGRAAGMYTIAAAYGYIEPGDSAHRWGADVVVESSMGLSEPIFNGTP